MSLEIKTLGRIQVIVDGVDVTPQLEASRIFLLTYLADTSQPQPREHLAELLWPDRPNERARSNLRTLLSRLRPHLAAYLQATPEWVALQPSHLIHFDVQAFEAQVAGAQHMAPAAAQHALATAMIHYQGDFLTTYAGAWTAEMESWLMARRLALHGLAVQTLRQLLTETSEHALATSIGYARQLLKLEPLDEAACGQLMGYLAQNGQRDEALWHYQCYQRALTETWATAAPSEDLVMLAAKIRLGLRPAASSSITNAQRVRLLTERQSIEAHSSLLNGHQSAQASIKADRHVPQPVAAADPEHRMPLPIAPSRLPETEAPTVHLHFPATVKPLIGRTREYAQLIQWLDLGYRLISITGLGGVGKSHFVRTVIAAQQQRWRNGALFVSLPASTNFGGNHARPGARPVSLQVMVATLCRTLAAALDLSLQPHQDYGEQIQAALLSYHCCIVLDNFETFLPAASYVQHLLTKAGGVTIVITSRLHLELAAAVNITLTGLPLEGRPPGRVRAPKEETVEDVGGTALALLVHNLARHLPSFQIRPADLPALHRICRALHGLPLALEMAPVLARRYTLAVVADKLEGEPLLLTADFGDLPAEQRSLYTVMNATFAAASPAIQEAVVRLSVFTGVFIEESANCLISSTLLDSLRQQSWVETLDCGRFALHPLVAAFVRSQCVELHWAQVYQKARRQHADYYAKSVATQPFLHDSYHRESVAWLHQHFDQVVNASLTLVEQAAPAALNLLHAIAIHGHHYGDLQRVQQWLQQGLAFIPKDTPGRLRLLIAYASGATELGHIADAAATLAEARMNLSETTAREEIAALYERLGWAAHLEYSAESAQRRRDGYTYFSQALQLAEEMDDQPRIVKMLIQRAFLACWETTTHAQAHTDMMRAVEIAHRLHQQGQLGNVYKMFAFVEFVAGRPALALCYSEQAIQLLQAEPHATMTLGWLYGERCQIALALHDITAAGHYANLALATFEPASFIAGIAHCDVLLGTVAWLSADLVTAERHWRRAYAAASKLVEQEKVLTMAMIGIGLVQLAAGDQMAGATLLAAAAAKYRARAFHWVQPEQAFIETLLTRAETQRGPLVESMPVNLDLLIQAMPLVASSA